MSRFSELILGRKPVAPVVETPDPETRLKDAVDELNAAWAASNGKVRPWVVWADREVVLVKAGAPLPYYRSGDRRG